MIPLPPPALLLACVVGGYVLGSIPFGVIATRLGGVGDIRQVGSGNIGATNVLRTGRKDLAAITLLGDALKGAAAVLLARWLCHEGAGHGTGAGGALAGAAAFLGHLFPVWLRFRGGKGVATFFGILFASAWPVGLAAGAVWIGVAAALRYSSLAALTAAALSPALALLLHQSRPASWMASFAAVLIFVRHAANIKRLRAGTEPRIGKRT